MTRPEKKLCSAREFKNSVASLAPLSWRFASVLSPPGGERIEERGFKKAAIVLLKLL